MSKMRLKKSKVIVEPSDGQQSRFFYNIMEIIQKKGGDSACPLPLPTPAPCDSVVLPALGLSQLGASKVAGASRRKKPPGTL